ncbi:abortive infection family protein [Microvirga terrae]|uniref:Abortive infection family protein n=1 Tax=Microvirga terrae TaxID=2740529 RepID=A0ABY5RPN4_9HYPH|nr:abortive infection family protein [Microvirga terrae]UVF18854.1 abortive infection family protein [Microvirga terrae]
MAQEFKLQLIRALIVEHPDRAAPLQRPVEALEASIEGEPEMCLHRVRSLFEVAHHTLAPHLGVNLAEQTEFPARTSRILKAMDFSIAGHPDAERIGATIQKLLGSINGMAGALSELSNYRNLRHGGSPDWSSLGRQHAKMLGGLCDSLVSFLFDVAWTRSVAAPEQRAPYDTYPAFNEFIDEFYGSFEVDEAQYSASQVLYALDETVYETKKTAWLTEIGTEDEGKEAAA